MVDRGDYCTLTENGTLRDFGKDGDDNIAICNLDDGTKVQIMLDSPEVSKKTGFFSYRFVRIYVRNGAEKGEKGWFRKDKLALDRFPFRG